MNLHDRFDGMTCRLLYKKPPSSSLLGALQEAINAPPPLQLPGSQPLGNSSSSSTTEGSLAALPLVLLQDILARCDVHSASSAAGACHLMRLAHRHNSSFDLPGTLRIFMEAVEQINASSEEYGGDGSVESSFVIQVPLDGSVVCGADLKEAVSSNRLLKHLMMPSMAAFMGGGTA